MMKKDYKNEEKRVKKVCLQVVISFWAVTIENGKNDNVVMRLIKKNVEEDENMKICV